MVIPAAPTLVALSAFGQYCHYKELPGVDTPKTLLRRVIADGREFLTIVERDQLGLFDRIFLFFGHPDFKLSTIQRLAKRALRSRSLDLCASGGSRDYISKAVDVLNTSIDHHNNHTLWFLYTKVKALAAPKFKSLSQTHQPTAPKNHRRYGRTERARIKKREAVQAAAQAALAQPLPPVGRIRGLVNPGCLCYSNASLVALYASPAFRRMLEAEKGELARLLRAVFIEMGDQRHLTTSLCRAVEGPFQALHAKLCSHPELGFLARYREQQDAQEFVGPLLDLVFSDNHDKFQVVSHTERSTLEFHEYEGAPPLENLYLPTIDKGASTLLENMVFANIPNGAPLYFVRDFFDGSIQAENVEVEAIINNGHNKALTEEQKAALRIAGGESGCLDPILVRTSHRLKNPAPSFLPFYIPRFTQQGEKNFTPAVAPYRLSVPVEGEQDSVQYELKSVVVHNGGSKGSGHYYTYIPDPTVIDETGYPTRWIKASDSSPKEVLPWSRVAQDIATQGVLFMYDKIEQEPGGNGTPV
jgi:hypothetical protein